jgi:hypothetical protein
MNCLMHRGRSRNAECFELFRIYFHVFVLAYSKPLTMSACRKLILSSSFITASNILDELFLAQFLRRACPDARIVFYNGEDRLVERDVDNVKYIGSVNVTSFPSARSKSPAPPSAPSQILSPSASTTPTPTSSGRVCPPRSLPPLLATRIHSPTNFALPCGPRSLAETATIFWVS